MCEQIGLLSSSIKIYGVSHEFYQSGDFVDTLKARFDGSFQKFLKKFKYTKNARTDMALLDVSYRNNILFNYANIL